MSTGKSLVIVLMRQQTMPNDVIFENQFSFDLSPDESHCRHVGCQPEIFCTFYAVRHEMPCEMRNLTGSYAFNKS